jgi:hypothetical protein
VLGRLLRTASVVLCALVIVSFAAFAVDQARDASERQQDLAAGILEPDPTERAERAREREHGDVREAIDDVNDVLLAPFAWVVDSDEIWVQRGVPTLLALLVYGFGLSFVARYASGRP